MQAKCTREATNQSSPRSCLTAYRQFSIAVGDIRRRKKSLHKSRFSAFLHCAECGSAITGEIQKGHTYYRCTKKDKSRPCKQPYIREEALDAEITALLKPFSLRADWADEMLLRVKEEKKQSAQTACNWRRKSERRLKR